MQLKRRVVNTQQAAGRITNSTNVRKYIVYEYGLSNTELPSEAYAKDDDR